MTSQTERITLFNALYLKHPYGGYTRHWITKNQEHMVDYGSHAFYGRITSIKNK